MIGVQLHSIFPFPDFSFVPLRSTHGWESRV
jgi:hypothetical protein